jgi:hypothetical protein
MFKGSKVQRSKDPKIQRSKKVQRFKVKDPKVQRSKGHTMEKTSNKEHAPHCFFHHVQFNAQQMRRRHFLAQPLALRRVACLVCASTVVQPFGQQRQHAVFEALDDVPALPQLHHLESGVTLSVNRSIHRAKQTKKNKKNKQNKQNKQNELTTARTWPSTTWSYFSTTEGATRMVTVGVMVPVAKGGV